mgnify:CR=1 FL=1
MKSFKQYITEIGVDPFKIVGAPAWTESLSSLLFDLRGGGLKNIMIPLSPAIMRRIWPKPVRTTVFHLTDEGSILKLKGMQGGKRSISAFFNIDPYIISSGIKSEGGFIVEMDADILIASQDDLSSQPDKTGRRWVTFQSLTNSPTDPMPGLGGKAKLRGMEKDIEKMLWKIIKTHSMYPNQTEPTVAAAWVELGDERHYYKKILSLIIRDYLDGMEGVMKKNSRALGSLLTAYTKKRIQDEDPDSGDRPYWDELVVNNFKIKMVHISPLYADEYQDAEDIEGLPFKIYDDYGDMTDYIDRKIQRIKL